MVSGVFELASVFAEIYVKSRFGITHCDYWPYVNFVKFPSKRAEFTKNSFEKVSGLTQMATISKYTEFETIIDWIGIWRLRTDPMIQYTVLLE